MIIRHVKSATGRSAAVLFLVLPWLAWTIGCGKTGSNPPELVEIPLPDTSNLDKVVQEQLRNKQSMVAELRECRGTGNTQLSKAYGEMGMLYHSYALFDAAEACYRNAHAFAPREFRWNYYLANIYAWRGDSDNAIVAFRRALSMKGGDVPALAGLAKVYLETNRPDDAEPLFKQALAGDATCAAAHVGLGRIAVLRGAHELAVRHFETALQLQPEANAIHYSLAMAYRNLRQTDKAAEHLRQRGPAQVVVFDPLMAAVEALPIGAQRHTQIGVAAVRSGNMSVALEELRKAVEADPNDSSLRLNLGSALGLSGDRKGAIDQFREAISLMPRFARAHCSLAAMLHKDGAVEEAMRSFQDAVTCDPQLFDAHLELARLAAETGKPPLAIKHYASAIEINPGHVPARKGHVIALTKAGRHAEAMDSLDKSLKIFPKNIDLTHIAARLLATCPDDRFRDGPKALELAQALFGTLQSLEHGETLAMALAETGNFEDAKKWQTKAIELATRGNRRNDIPRLERNLALYENGKPCRALGSALKNKDCNR